MPRLLVIADDLTGACDTGVQFAKKGIPVLVLTGIRSGSADFSTEHQVVVVNTESRHVESREAGRRVAKIVELGLAAGITYFYKKTDSTLRGNIGSELEALMISSGQNRLPFIPALPKLGRTTREGLQYVGDKPLHETEFSRDPADPIADSFIPSIIRKQTRIQTKVVKATDVASSPPFDEKGIYIFDVATDDDLQLIGEILNRNDLLTTAAGSAGFAEYLPDLLSFATEKSSHVYETGRMLVVNGSANEVSMMQVRNAEAQGFACVNLSPEILLAEHHIASSEALQTIARGVGRDEGRDVILRSAQSSGDIESYLSLGRKHGLDRKQTHDLMMKNLGAIAGQVLKQSNFKIMTVFGGDTLLAIAGVLGWSGFLPQQEILPGVVVSQVLGDLTAPLLITKAGGFGPEDILARIKRELGSTTK